MYFFKIFILFFCINFFYTNASNQSFKIEFKPKSYKIEDVDVLSYYVDSINVVRINFIFLKAGYANISNYKKVLPFFLEQMLFLKTKTQTSQEVESYLAKNNINISCTSDLDATIITLYIPKNKIETALEFLQKALIDFDFENDDFEMKKKSLIANLKQSLEDPSVQIDEFISKNYLKNVLKNKDHPYICLISEKISLIKNTKSIDLKKFIRENFTSKNLKINIAGDFDEKSINKYLKKFIMSLPNQYNDFKISQINYPISNTRYHIEYNLPQTNLLFFSNCVSIDDNDITIIELASKCLFDFPIGEIANQVRGGQNNLVYFILNNIFHKKYSDLNVVMTSTASATTPRTIQVIRDKMKALLKHGIDSKIFAIEKQSRINDYKQSFCSTAQISDCLNSMQIFDLKTTIVEDNFLKWQKISIDEVNQAIKKYFDFKNFTIISVGKYEKTNK